MPIDDPSFKLLSGEINFIYDFLSNGNNSTLNLTQTYFSEARLLLVSNIGPNLVSWNDGHIRIEIPVNMTRKITQNYVFENINSGGVGTGDATIMIRAIF